MTFPPVGALAIALLAQAAMLPAQVTPTQAGSVYSPILRLADGHNGKVNGARFTPDGRLALTAGDDGKLRLWDAATGRTIRVAEVDKRAITDLALSRNGQTIAMSTWDGTVKIWSLASFSERWRLVGHEAPVEKVAISPDGRRAVSAGGTDRTARVWDLDRGTQLFVLSHRERVTSVAISNDGRYVATSDVDATRIWDLTNGNQLSAFSQLRLGAKAMQFSSDGRYLAAGGFDELGVWDLRANREVWKKVEDFTATSGVAFSLDGALLAAATQLPGASARGVIRLYEVASGRLLRNIVTGEYFSESVAFSPENDRLLAAEGYLARVRDLTGRVITSFDGVVKQVNFARFAPRGTAVLSGSAGYDLELWDLRSGRTLRRFSGHSRWAQARFSPDGRRVVSASGDGTLRIWDAATGLELLRLIGHRGMVTAARFSTDGRLIVSAGEDFTVRLWDANTGRALETFPQPQMVNDVALSPDSRLIGVASFDWKGKLIDAASGNVVQMKEIENVASSIAFSPDGSMYALGSYGSIVHVYGVRTSEEVGRVSDTSAVMKVLFLPDGKRLLTGSSDGRVRLWNLVSDQAEQEFAGPRAEVRTIDINSSGTHVVATFADNSIWVWRTTSPREAFRRYALVDSQWVVMTPDGRFDGSDGGLKQLYFVRGMQILPIETYTSRYTRGLSGVALGPVAP